MTQEQKLGNAQRIHFIKEMGFEYEATRNEDGSLREHIITHPEYKGFFVNHTSLLCAIQRIPTMFYLLGKANESLLSPAPVDAEVQQAINAVTLREWSPMTTTQALNVLIHAATSPKCERTHIDEEVGRAIDKARVLFPDKFCQCEGLVKALEYIRDNSNSIVAKFEAEEALSEHRKNMESL